MRTALILGLICLIATPRAVFSNPVLAETDSTSEDGGDELSAEPKSSAEKTKKPRRAPPPSFNRFSGSLQSLCDYLERDGRLEAFSNRLVTEVQWTEGCVACKRFQKVLKSKCRVDLAEPKGKKPKEQREANDTEEKGAESGEGKTTAKSEGVDVGIKRVLHHEPTAAAIDAVSRLGIELAEDPEQIEERLEIIARCIEALRNSAGRSRGEQEYFSILTEYLYSPFAGYARILEQRHAKIENHEQEQNRKEALDVDSLFDF